MMYSLIFLVNENVSWLYDHVEDSKHRWGIQRQAKLVASAEQMCENFAKPLEPILEGIYNLKYDEKPNYEEMKLVS